MRETVIDGETGLLVGNHSELHLALERILNDEVLARRMGAAASVAPSRLGRFRRRRIVWSRAWSTWSKGRVGRKVLDLNYDFDVN